MAINTRTRPISLGACLCAPWPVLGHRVACAKAGCGRRRRGETASSHIMNERSELVLVQAACIGRIVLLEKPSVLKLQIGFVRGGRGTAESRSKLS